MFLNRRAENQTFWSEW